MFVKHTLFYKKTIFLPELQFYLHNTRNYAEIFLIFFLTFISLFSLDVYLVRFKLKGNAQFVQKMTF